MIARFMNEALVINKNTSLKKFIYSNFSKKVLSDTVVKTVVEGEYNYSMNLTDGKPGNWCVMDWRGDSYLFVSCSYEYTHNKQEFRNSIIVSRFSEEKDAFPWISNYFFTDSVILGTEKAKNAAMFIRKLMHSPKVMSGNYAKADRMIQKESKIQHSWE